MRVVAIVKTYGELEQTAENKRFPPEWPAQCEEFMTVSSAQHAHPNLDAGRIMSIENYVLYSRGLSLAHELIPPVVIKSWWQFWK